jgi:hypothetical protein
MSDSSICEAGRSVLTSPRGARYEVSPMRSPIYGRMFWFNRKKFVGSCLRLSARSRSYLASP